ncbi:SAM-dependent methyltransferase [Streptomyces hainanensis]|uniref:SAM-dependent methyltransferase n=1 Tax=Streptomyces hainanensis TaxID=402648 RepID=A0A4R4TI24_9ACTN|nr:SAM-dependent methyltransferase [Streptomyces hainanensis]TDC74643.1 SAM-dependent methyltransferase [Streptomyces hainanensis]
MSDQQDRRQPAAVGDDVPASHRFWDALAGGTDHRPADLRAAAEVERLFPELVAGARATRPFQARVVRHLVEAGVRQFIDLGTGLPSAGNTHRLAQDLAPDARIVSVDIDPRLIRHVSALMPSSSEGAADYVAADIRDVDAVLDRAAATLDLARPVAVLAMSMLGHLPPGTAPGVVRRYTAALAPGSHLAVCDSWAGAPGVTEASDAYNATGAMPYHLFASLDELADTAAGLTILDPGVVPVDHWRPDTPAPAPGPGVGQFGLLAVKD